MNVNAEQIPDMYKASWAIESFFHWIKDYLNIPILLGNSQNVVFTKITIDLSVFVILRCFSSKKKEC